MNLISNYNLTGTIAISKNADEREFYAASELRYYLCMMIGAPIVAKCIEAAENDVVIVLGSARALYGEELETFEEEELHWYVKNNMIFIDGGKRGLLYGVYDFLESLGCRFYAEDCEKIPTYENLELADTDKHDKPHFLFRSIYHYDCATNFPFATKLRVNGGTNIPSKMGGISQKSGGVHTFTWLMPYNTYYKEHPEWYGLFNGVRGMGVDYVDPTKKAYWDLCLTNPDVLAELIKNTREYLRANPQVEIMNISQNDSHSVCQCENCLAVDAEEGCRTGLVLRTVNAVAEALEEEFPNVLFEHLAYNQNENLPKITKPRHNVTIKLCSMGSCCLHPMVDACPRQCEDSSTPFIENLKAWGQFGRPLYIWDYVTNFCHYNMSHPNWRILQPNYQLFYENNVSSFFVNANITKGGGADLEELRTYLITKLMWNPYFDYDTEMKEFTDCYYGAAGKYVYEYINTMCDCAEQAGEHFGCYYSPEIKYMDPEYMVKYKEILNRALDAVKDDPIRAARVDKIMLSLRYVDVHRQLTLEHIHDVDAINKLFSDFVAYGIEEFEGGANARDSIFGFLYECPRGKYDKYRWEIK